MPGFRLYATDFPSSLPARRVDTRTEMLRSQFCLAPTGTGFGTRTVIAIVLGCIPVIVQHDGVHDQVAQPFEDQLDWEEFSVRISHKQIAQLPAILRAVDVEAKQTALQKVWSRLLWRDTFSPSAWPGEGDVLDAIMQSLRRMM